MQACLRYSHTHKRAVHKYKLREYAFTCSVCPLLAHVDVPAAYCLARHAQALSKVCLERLYKAVRRADPLSQLCPSEKWASFQPTFSTNIHTFSHFRDYVYATIIP
jgi:hypothetical protein